MAKLWRDNPETPEGKYPIVLRRDGTPLESRYIVMVLKDPCTAAALNAYANKAQELGLGPEYVASMYNLAHDAEQAALEDAGKTSDPDAPRHRKDNPTVLLWAQSLGCPGS